MDVIYNSIMGLIVGDACGVPVEFKKRDTFKVDCMTGYGTYNQPCGTWSDDSSMTLATMDSIARLGKISPKDIMNSFYSWLEYGTYTPYGDVFDVGSTARAAIRRYSQGVPLKRCGGKTRMDNGNGSLMRILPLAFVECRDKDIAEISALTHAHEISKTACIIYITIVRGIMRGDSLKQAIAYGAYYTDLPEFGRLNNLQNLSRDEISSTGYVVDTLEAALWCLLHSDNYRDCILLAVNLGGDTDTIAAVTGGLAGLMWKVPDDYISQLASLDTINEILGRFIQVASSSFKL